MGAGRAGPAQLRYYFDVRFRNVLFDLFKKYILAVFATLKFRYILEIRR